MAQSIWKRARLLGMKANQRQSVQMKMKITKAVKHKISVDGRGSQVTRKRSIVRSSCAHPGVDSLT
jgi:hypothetical protein